MALPTTTPVGQHAPDPELSQNQRDLQAVLDELNAGTYMRTDVLTTNGDLLVRAGGVPARLGVGSDGQLLTVVSGAPAWADAPAGGGGQTPWATKRWGTVILGAMSGATAPIATRMGTPILSNGITNFADAYSNVAAYGISGAGIGATSQWHGPFTETRIGWGPILTLTFYLDSTITSQRHWVALASTDLATVACPTGAAASAISYVGICRDTGVSNNWYLASGDGTNHSGTDSGVAGTASNLHQVTIDASVMGQFTVTLKRAQDGYQTGFNWTTLFTATKSTNVPAAAGKVNLGVIHASTMLSASNRWAYLANAMLQHN